MCAILHRNTKIHHSTCININFVSYFGFPNAGNMGVNAGIITNHHIMSDGGERLNHIEAAHTSIRANTDVRANDIALSHLHIGTNTCTSVNNVDELCS